MGLGEGSESKIVLGLEVNMKKNKSNGDDKDKLKKNNTDNKSNTATQ